MQMTNVLGSILLGSGRDIRKQFSFRITLCGRKKFRLPLRLWERTSKDETPFMSLNAGDVPVFYNPAGRIRADEGHLARATPGEIFSCLLCLGHDMNVGDD